MEHDDLLKEIIISLNLLGGKDKLENIYDKVRERNVINLSKYTDWKAQIRKRIYQHSSDTDIFNGEIDDITDIFYSIDGKGKGVWGLRNSFMNNQRHNVSVK